jgi:hypothetical protein
MEDFAMTVRSYQPGDEHAQARIYNAATASLPGFKAATAEEIARRYQAADFDPQTRLYAEENGEVLGYAVFTSNGRVSCPWCLPGMEASREPLLEAVCAEMANRGFAEAWAAYRADWAPVLDFLSEHGFREKRLMINFVADVSRLVLSDQPLGNDVIEPLQRDELSQLVALEPRLFGGSSARALDHFFWENPLYSFPGSLWTLKDGTHRAIRGAYSLVVDASFADPTKIDPAMPCFRLGAFGTESERHKRVNGLFSCVFEDEADGDVLLSSALRSSPGSARLTHLAAQVPSDAEGLCDWFGRRFLRQGSFPIMARRLSSV